MTLEGAESSAWMMLLMPAPSQLPFRTYISDESEKL
jgi:hypothetical protein